MITPERLEQEAAELENREALAERVNPSGNDRWWEHGRCKGQGGSGSVWWEPWKHTPAAVAAALALCNVCPVKAQCAADDAGYCIQGGRAHTSKQRPPTPRPKKQMVCSWCASMFEGVSRQFCSDSCLRSARRDKQRKAEKVVTSARTNVRRTDVRTNAVAGQGDACDVHLGPDGNPTDTGAPALRIVRDFPTPAESAS
jgi:hypothetical protein